MWKLWFDLLCFVSKKISLADIVYGLFTGAEAIALSPRTRILDIKDV